MICYDQTILFKIRVHPSNPSQSVANYLFSSHGLHGIHGLSISEFEQKVRVHPSNPSKSVSKKSLPRSTICLQATDYTEYADYQYLNLNISHVHTSKPCKSVAKITA